MQVLSQAERFDQAIEECQALLKEYRQPGEIREIRYVLSSVYSAAKRSAEAAEQLQLILEQDPNDATANNDLGYLWASPQPALWGQVRAWFLEALEKAGIAIQLGPALFSLFREAGLPGPRLLVEAHAEGGPGAPAWGWANVVSAAVPLMEKTGVATRAEVDPATLAGRLLAETLGCGGYVITPPMTGAWVTRPSGPAR